MEVGANPGLVFLVISPPPGGHQGHLLRTKDAPSVLITWEITRVSGALSGAKANIYFFCCLIAIHRKELTPSPPPPLRAAPNIFRPCSLGPSNPALHSYSPASIQELSSWVLISMAAYGTPPRMNNKRDIHSFHVATLFWHIGLWFSLTVQQATCNVSRLPNFLAIHLFPNFYITQGRNIERNFYITQREVTLFQQWKVRERIVRRATLMRAPRRDVSSVKQFFRLSIEQWLRPPIRTAAIKHQNHITSLFWFPSVSFTIWCSRSLSLGKIYAFFLKFFSAVKLLFIKLK